MQLKKTPIEEAFETKRLATILDKAGVAAGADRGNPLAPGAGAQVNHRVRVRVRVNPVVNPQDEVRRLAGRAAEAGANVVGGKDAVDAVAELLRPPADCEQQRPRSGRGAEVAGGRMSAHRIGSTELVMANPTSAMKLRATCRSPWPQLTSRIMCV